MVQIPLTFHPQRTCAVTKIPASTPISAQLALLALDHCVPDPAPGVRRLLLCDEATYAAWQREVEEKAPHGGGRTLLLLAQEMEFSPSLRLRLSNLLLHYAGIGRQALLTICPDGTALLTPAAQETAHPL